MPSWRPLQALAPAQPRMTDRNDYEYTGRQPLTANCPNTIYCYRILVPVLLEQVPMDPEPLAQAAMAGAHRDGLGGGDGDGADRFTTDGLGPAADVVRLHLYGLRPLHARPSGLPDLGAGSVFVACRSGLRGRR